MTTLALLLLLAPVLAVAKQLRCSGQSGHPVKVRPPLRPL